MSNHQNLTLNSHSISLIAQHVSWLSIDPLLGCPAQCAYCYLHPLGLTKSRPEPRVSPTEVYSQLLEHTHFRKDIFGRSMSLFPICIGNYTDMCLTPLNRSYLLKLLELHKKHAPDTPICIVTKGKLTHEFLGKIDHLKLRVIFVISLSFMPELYEVGTQPSAVRLENFSRIAEYEYIHALHYWRPITAISTPDSATAAVQIKSLMAAKASASILVGLTFGKDLKQYWQRSLSNPLHSFFDEQLDQHPEQKHAITNQAIIRSIIDEANLQEYPAFLNTTCAVSYVLEQPEYSGIHRGVFRRNLCLPAGCPLHQRGRCATHMRDHQIPPSALLNEVARILSLDAGQVRYDPTEDSIIVPQLTDGAERFLSQTTGYLVRAEQVTQTLEWSIATKRAEQALMSRPKEVV